MLKSHTVRFLPAEFLTTNHFIFGQMRVPPSGFFGMMSDPTSAYLEINDVSIARILKPDKVINYAQVLWLVKQQIVAVCVNKREYIGVQAIARSGYTRMIPYSVQITTPDYEITGTLEWSGRFEISVLMSEGTNAFLVLFDAVLSGVLFPNLHIERPAILLNRNYLNSMICQKKTSGEDQ
jgi:hypothetical protein